VSEQSITQRLAQHESARESRGQRTRQSLRDAALRLLEGDRSFTSLSLREVTREAGVVPTAFYRHYTTMEELGLELVTESFQTLRRMTRSVRNEGMPTDNIIRSSVEIVVRHIHEHRLHFQFIARERYGGYASLREAIRREIRLFAAELATDLARFPLLDHWDTEDLQMLASLMVGAMVSIAEEILDAPSRPEAETEIMRRAEKQLTLILLGIPAWRSRPLP
jgi:AcrR family transcriptional regulator